MRAIIIASILLLLIAASYSVFGDATTSPKIVIIGAGASGIAAASKLLENGFENVLILEAEDRIGGRIQTVQFDGYSIDLGAQWIHGQKGNVAYELAAPLDLVAYSNKDESFDLYDSSGTSLDRAVVKNITAFYLTALNNSTTSIAQYNGSVGDYLENEFKKYFDEHPDLNKTVQNELLSLFNLMQTSLDSSDSWYQVSTKGYSEYENCEGDNMINWKERGYSTILDVLMKRLPNPEEELPILNKTVLNAEVTKIDYTDQNNVKLTTLDGKEYIADHVIVTPSLGVLKAQYSTLFEPSLPEEKIRAINGLAFGTAAKIFIAFDNPWWGSNIEKNGFAFLWTENDRKKLENDSDRKWLLSTIGYWMVEYKPRLLFGWLSAEGARVMETLPDEIVLNQTMEILQMFLGNDYNITEPKVIIKSDWYKNKHFRGTYSYRSLETETIPDATAETLSLPIMKGDKTVILFGGEATNKFHYSTVHGAIESGWREADRLIKLYSKNASSEDDISKSELTVH